MNSSESVKNIAQALNKAQSEMGAVVKGSDNPYYKSKYADINDVIKTVKEVLNNNGITYLQPLKVIEVAGEKVTVVETLLLHTSGEYLSSETEVVQKDKNDPQKYGAAITYSRRFGLQSIVGLPAEDDDGNSASGVGEKKTSSARGSKKTEKKEEKKETSSLRGRSRTEEKPKEEKVDSEGTTKQETEESGNSFRRRRRS